MKVLNARSPGRAVKSEGGDDRSMVLRKRLDPAETARSTKEKLAYIKKRRFLYYLLIPVILYFLLFHYAPIWGILLAFQDYNPLKGLAASPWVGMKHFVSFFNGRDMVKLFRNTLLINFYALIFSFPCPIIFALMLNEIRSMRYRRVMQTITYLPHFLSSVVIVGMLTAVLSPSTGIVNAVIKNMGGESIYFMAMPRYFRTLYIASGIWSGTGWGSIIYLAAITGIDPTLYEAASIDGAGKWTQVWNITLPCLLPTIVFMLIMRIGNMLSIGFEKIYLMSSSPVKDVSYVISVYVYEKGIVGGSYSFSTAVGLFNSVISLILVSSANAVSRKVAGMGIW